MFFVELLGARRSMGLRVARVVLGVVIFQNRPQAAALILFSLIGFPSLGRQSVLVEPQVLPRGQFWFY